jgi:hypothetical protein
MVEMGFPRSLPLHPAHYSHQHSHQLTHTNPRLRPRNANLGLYEPREHFGDPNVKLSPMISRSRSVGMGIGGRGGGGVGLEMCGRILFAGVLPTSGTSTGTAGAEFQSERPLVGIA